MPTCRERSNIYIKCLEWEQKIFPELDRKWISVGLQQAGIHYYFNYVTQLHRVPFLYAADPDYAHTVITVVSESLWM